MIPALLRRATELVPVLKERAAAAERLRQIPPETVKDLIASSLIRIGNPRRYGGLDADLDTIHEVSWELARGCGSTAWCYSLWATHNWWLGHFPERAQDEFFADGPDTLFSSGLDPSRGTAEPVDGGFRVSGRWSYSSGCDAASWVMVATTPSDMLWLLLPRGDYEIVDTWFSSGLRGSGSKDVVVTDRFVPAHRAIHPDRAGDGEATGWTLHARPSYRPPLRCLTGWDLAAPVIGMAQGAIDEVTARPRAAQSVALQLRVAEASAEVDAARALQRADVREILDRAAREEPFTERDRARYRRDKAFVVKLSVQAVNRLFEASGARGVLESEAIQRFHRDVHAASHHAALGWDAPAEHYGRLAMGP